MDLNAPISYNGITISGVTTQANGGKKRGIVIERCDPSNMDVTGYFDKIAMRDGMDAGEGFLGARQFNIVAGVYGTSKGDTWDQLGSVLEAFDPFNATLADSELFGFQPMTFYRPTADISTWPTSAYPNGIPLQYYVRPARPPLYTINREATTDGFSITVQVPMVAREPFAFAQTATSAALTTTTNGVALANNGTRATWPIFAFTMTAAGHSAMAVEMRSPGVGTTLFATVTLNLASITTGSYSVDFASRAITDSNDAFANSLFSTASPPEFYPVRVPSALGSFRARVSTTQGTSVRQLIYTDVWL
jgi:hypothetical protein